MRTAVTALWHRSGGRRSGRLQPHTCGFVGTIIATGPRGNEPFREISPLLTNAVCSRTLLISAPAVSEYEYSVCGVPMCSKAQVGVQTVPRHITLSRAGFPFSKPSPRRSSGLVGNHVHHLLLNREFDSCGNQNLCHFFSSSGKRGTVSK